MGPAAVRARLPPMPRKLMQMALREPVEQPLVAKPSAVLARSRELPPRLGRMRRQPHHPVRMSRPARQFPKPALDCLGVPPEDHRPDDPRVSCPHRWRPVRHRTPRVARAPHPPRRRWSLTERRDSGRRNHRGYWQHHQPRSPAQRQRFRRLPVPSFGRPWVQRSQLHRVPSMGWPCLQCLHQGRAEPPG